MFTTQHKSCKCRCRAPWLNEYCSNDSKGSKTNNQVKTIIHPEQQPWANLSLCLQERPWGVSDRRQVLQNLHRYGDRHLTAIKMLIVDFFVTFSTSCVFMFFPCRAPPHGAMHDLLEGLMLPQLRCLGRGGTWQNAAPTPSSCCGWPGRAARGAGGERSMQRRQGKQRGKRGTPSEPRPGPWLPPCMGMTGSSGSPQDNHQQPIHRG